ncbi:conserved oligomeric Golgi complex subunit 1-like [Actinia tenebrosa]|uniref:Conserved oligomeric Golgi complex subunit 1 n=1 Tax=Actinia tenebrosa TaxID=6105 RepID=A0A6P8IXZ8_ACTTE|nr:conserved oligomeric Golgi complex subunit 1-like [Actinia tenebrosa]
MASPRSPRSPTSSSSSPRQDSSKSSQSISWDAEIDVNTLFVEHSIEEIRALEKKTRGDIEKKKEELRLMVGERYRDLIDAADTITEMKDYTKKITTSVGDIQKQCKELHQSHRCYGVGGSPSVKPTSGSPHSKNGFYSLAAQMKLLVDTPEKIWSALERQQYLKATQLYLLSHHIVSILHLNSGSGAAPRVLSSFPILQRQWAAISHFKDSIIQGSRALLKDATQTDEMTAEALCSILLLEESSPRQVFSEFLLARKSSLQEIFHPSQHSTSIKSQVCELIRVMRTSLYQIHSIFICDVENTEEIHDVKDNPAMLFQTLNRVTKRDKSDPNIDEEVLEALFGPDFDLVTSARYLPKTVLEYRPHIRAFPATIPLPNIQGNCEEWIGMCLKDISSGVGKLLTYVGTLKGLASMRDAIWELLKECDSNAQFTQDNEVVELEWNQLCTKVINHELSLWDKFMRPLFVNRAKAILSGLLDATVVSCQNMIIQSQDDLSVDIAQDTNALWERDISRYVWHESVNDVPLASLWGNQSGDTKKQSLDGDGLALKARGCTPAVQRLCVCINEKLQATSDDAQHFISKIKDTQSSEKSRVSISGRAEELGIIVGQTDKIDEKGPFDRFSDAKEIQTFLQDTCFDAFNRLLNNVDKSLTDHKKKLESCPSIYDTTSIDRVLFVGRLCHCMVEQCPQLKIVMRGAEPEEKPNARQSTPRLSRQSSLSKRKTEQTNDTKLKELAALIKNRYYSAFRLWKDWVCDIFVKSYEDSLLKGGTEAALFSMTSWEELKIQEESETGEKVQSTIRVPMQVSSFVTSLLFSLCQELNRIGAHALDRKILQELVDTLSDNILHLYEKLVEESETSLPQNRSLQCLFDFKFISAIFAGRSDEPIQESTESFSVRREAVIDSLEGVVDPFDLDVFSPYLAANLNRQLQRCGVLFGVLVSLDKHSNHSFGVTSRPSGSQDQHNIMPLAPNPPRFTLLPLSSHQSSLYGLSSGTRLSEPKKSSKSQMGQHSSLLGSTAFSRHDQFFNLKKNKEQTVI